MIEERFQWWNNLLHGGLLLDTQRLRNLIPEDPAPLDSFEEDRLRRRITTFLDDPDEKRGQFVSFVLEAVCGLRRPLGEWSRGSEVSTAWSRRAITGESIRPRHLWISPNGAVVPVFIDDEKRLGVGRGKRIISHALQWLRQGDEQLAIVTNGHQWRLVFAGLDYDAFCEWDIVQWFTEGQESDELRGLRSLLSPSLWTPAGKGEACPLLTAINESRKGQSDLSQVLGERVRQAVELLVRAHAPVLNALPSSACGRGAVGEGGEGHGLAPQDIYRAGVRMIMRMVVVLFAESREGLLPRDNPIYHNAYSLGGLRDQLERTSRHRRRGNYAAYPRILSLFRLIHEGCSHEALLVSQYGGELFALGNPASDDGMSRAMAIFENGWSEQDVVNDDEVRDILDLLTRTKVKIRQGRANFLMPAPVDFSRLDSEYIGILYEGLLDFELRTAPGDQPIVFLAVGNQPALPLATLEAMDDRAIRGLLEKFKDTSTNSEEEDESEENSEATNEEQIEPEEDQTEVEEEDVESVDEPAADNGTEQDIRHTTRARAEAWARRACELGNLFTRPRGKMTPERRMQYEAALARKARQIITRVVLPGEWYLVRWGGTRKGSGTFYTRPQLAVPTVHRTLRPLAYDPPMGADGKPDVDAPIEKWTPKKPEEILVLKVCDPACGSGSFLLASLRFLTEALYKSLLYHDRIRDHAGRAIMDLIKDQSGEQTLASEALPCPPDDDRFESHTKAVLRRYIVERCIYGVDLDPLAIELCRLSLWIETLDRRLPFTFLEHKVKAGNSLVGAWFDQFLHYPVMAWDREGGDKNHTNGVHYEKEQWTKAIKERKKTVKTDLIKFIDGARLIYKIDLASVQTVHDEAEKALKTIHTLGIHQTEERAQRYHELRQSEDFRRMKGAFDLWCALWFWPADRLDAAPLPTEMAEGAISEAAWNIVYELAAQHRFFHWELEFPDVFNTQSQGFDVVLGNPPWDISKPISKEFFSAIDPLYRGYGKQEAIQKQNEFFRQDADIEHRWLNYTAHFKAMGNWVKYTGFPFGGRVTYNAQHKPEHNFPIGDRGRGSFESSQRRHDRWKQNREESSGYADADHSFCHQGSADVNLYKLFLEQAHSILAPTGRLGMIVPAGLYADHGTSGLRKLFLIQSSWEWLFGFINWRKIFQSVYYRFKFCICIIQRGGQTKTVNAAFDRYKIEEWEHPHDVLVHVEASQLSTFSPKSFAFLETRNQRDVVAAEKVFANCSLLGSATGDGWCVHYSREFDMTNDSKLFPPRPKWEEWGYRPDEYSRWIKGPWQPIAQLYAEIDAQPIIDREYACSQIPYDKLRVSRADLPEGIILSREATHFIREDEIPTVMFTDASGKTLTFSVKTGERTQDIIVEGPAIAVPLYEGRMIGHLEFTDKGWVSGKARSAVWREIQPVERWLEPQYLMADSAYFLSVLCEHLNSLGNTHSLNTIKHEFERLKEPAARSVWWLGKPTGVSIMDVTSATNARTTVCALTTLGPNGHSAPMLRSAISNPGLAGVLSTFVWDRMVRLRTNGVHLTWAILEESPLPNPGAWLHMVSQLTIRLNATGAINAELSLRHCKGLVGSWRSSWALTDHERLRVRCSLDAIVATQFGLDEADYRQIMLDCDHPRQGLTQLAYSGFDPKGFWRVDKDRHPEHRHTVLSLMAFHDLQKTIAACGGDVDKGIEAFCTENDGEGWMLPETLRLADYDLGHDDRAKEHQPVRDCFGPRFYDWQLAQSPEESWRECHLHARNLLGPEGYQALLDELKGKTPPPTAPPAAKTGSKKNGGNVRGKLFETEYLPLFDGKEEI